MATASAGQTLMRLDLSGEAIPLVRLLIGLLPEPEALGLLALMLLQESRRAARTSATGELVLLNEQDRSRWNRAEIDEGSALDAQWHGTSSSAKRFVDCATARHWDQSRRSVTRAPETMM